MKSEKQFSHKLIILMSLFLILMMISSDQSTAMFAEYSENPVDGDSNIDVGTNIGTSGNSPITIEETVTGGIALSNSITSPSITGVSGHLYIVVLSSKGSVDSTSVSGLGLTWSEIADQCGGRAQDSVSVWWAQGSASPGTVTANTGSTPSNTVIQVHRISNVASSNPIGANVSANTNGISGGCSGGSDNADPSVGITTTQNQAMVIGAMAVRSRNLTAGNGFTPLTENHFGIGGEMAGAATEYKITSPVQTLTVDGTLNSISDWALIAFEIKPATSTAYTDTQVLDSTYQDINEVNTYSGTQIEDPIDNDSSDIDANGKIGTLNNFVNAQSVDSSYATFNEELGNDNSAYLDGITTYFTVGSGNGLDFGSTSGTIEMWVKLDVIAGRLWGQNDNFETRFIGSQISFDFGTTNALAGGNIYVANKWYFIAITWDETGNDLSLYWGDEAILPTLDATNTTWTGAVSTQGTIGNNIMASRGGANPIDGYVDEFRYWNIERSLSEIREDFDTVLTGSESGLQNYYQFENSLEDSAGSTTLVQSTTGWSYSTDVSLGITDGYQMDLEVQFTNLIDFMEINKVSIYTGTTSAENIALSYWSGSVWTQLTSDLQPLSWNNFTVPVSSDIFTLQFNQGYSASDNSRDSTQIDVILFTHEGDGLYDDYIDQISNVDVTSDIGFQNSISDLQFKDGYSANLIENRGGSSIVNRESFESSMPFSIAGSWSRENDQAWQGTWSADNDGDDGGTGSMTTSSIDASDAISIHIEFYWFDNLLDDDDLWLRLYNGSSWVDIEDLNTVNSSDGWHRYSSTFTNSQYFVNNLLVRWTATSIGAGETAAIDYVSINIEHPVYQSFESGINTEGWSTTGANPFTHDNTQSNDGTYSAGFLGQIGTPNGFLESPIIDASGASSIIVDFFWRLLNQDQNNIELQFWDGSNWDDIQDGTNQDIGSNVYSENTWIHSTDYSWSSTSDPQYLISDFKIRFMADSVTANQYLWVDQVKLNVGDNFQLEREIQFTNIIVGIPKISLSIYSGTLGNEDLHVEYWNGTSWYELFTDLIANDWNNITITELITSDTFTIRFRDGNSISDGSQDFWQVDAVILNYDSKTFHYELDWEHQAQGIDTTKEFYLLTIYGNSSDIYENFNIQIWNQTSSSWTDPFSLQISSTLQWYNYTIPSNGLIGLNMTWRYTGSIDGSINLYDLNQTALRIDYAGIASYEELPVIQSKPADLEYNQGEIGNNLQWIVTDSNASIYKIYFDDVPGSPIPWSSEIPVVYNVDGLVVGTYNVTIELMDISGNIITDYVQVTVVDTQVPQVTSPNDFSYEAGQTGNQINWTSTDQNPDVYEIWNETHIIESATSWNSGVPVVYNVDGFFKGVYNFTIIFYDKQSRSSNDTVFVTVVDTTIPTVDGPSDITFEIGEVGNNIDWSLSDLDPGIYTIYQDNGQVGTGSWSTGVNITYNLDSLLAGTYEYVIVVEDDTGNSLNHTLSVIVTDFVDPLIDNPTEIPFAEGSTGNIITWNATDLDPGIYIIFENDTQISSSIWVSGVFINYNLDSLLKGSYNYTIVVYDRSGNFVNQTVMITVSDETLPTVTSPDDFQYFEGTTGHNITWYLIDNYPDQLTIYRNGIPLYSFGWLNDSNTIVIVDGLSAGLYNFTILINDESGLIAYDTIWMTVTDNTPPVISQPLDITYTISFTGNTIEWTGTDLHSSNYTVYNDTMHVMQSGTWISSNPIVVNIDGLEAGFHNYTIFLADIEGNLVNDTVTINVTEQSVFLDIPDDLYYIFTNTSYHLNWTVSDTNPANFTIFQDEVEKITGTWISGIPISWNVDNLPIGVYNFTIFINDTDGNMVTDLVWVTVSDQPELISFPLAGSLSYNETETGNYLNWTAVDMFNDTYIVYLDEVEYDTGFWSNGSVISINIDGLLKGTYNFTIVVYDTVNNTDSHSVTVTIYDNISPIVTSDPPNVQYNEGESFVYINWTVTENYPDNYVINNDTGQVDTGLLELGVNVTLNVGGLDRGVYNYTIIVYDESGNSDSIVVVVTVLDGTSPIFVDRIYNSTYAEGDIGKTISWDATDKYADRYEIWNSTHLLDSNSWSSGVPIVFVDMDGLLVGLQNFTIIFFDESNNWINNTITFTVTDETIPVVTSPGDPTMNEDAGGQTITWVGTDSYPDIYVIYKNGTPGAQIPWSDGIDITLDLSILDLPLGYHNFTIVILDQSGNLDSDTVIVRVVDGTDPTLSSPGDLQFSEGAISGTIDWTPGDLHADYYEFYIDAGLVDTSIWANGVDLEIPINTSHTKGVYIYTIIIYDESGRSVSDSVTVTVIDTTLPVFDEINSSYDPSYAEGDMGKNITWVAMDNYADRYEIWNSTHLNSTGTWISGVALEFDRDGLFKGSYNFTIIFFDESNNWINNTIIFTVTDEDLPVIDSPIDISYLEGEPNLNITWTVSDKYEDYYEIFNGSTVIDSGFWITGTIVLDVSGSILGDYTYTLYINDTSGNLVSDSVLVRVVELEPPQFTSEPINVQYNESSVNGQTLNWVATDSYNESYILYRNVVFFSSGNWDDGIDIIISLDGLKKGVYNYTILVLDSSGNSNSSSVWVTILDEAPPVLVGDLSDFSFESGSIGNEVSWGIFDNYDGTFIIYQDVSVKKSGTWRSPGNTEIIEIDDLSVGIYNFTLVAWDSSNNIVIDTIIVTVTDTISPTFTVIPVSTYNITEISLGNNLNFILDDVNPANYIIYLDDEIEVDTDPWVSGTPITWSADTLTIGVYNLTIVVYDESNHFINHTNIIRVTDVTKPYFISEPTIAASIIEGDSQAPLTWQMFDVHSSSYVIFFEDEEIASGSWVSFQTISQSINGLSTGGYNYTLFVNDTSSNILISTILITVVDEKLPIFNFQPSINNYTEGTTGHNLEWNVFEIHPQFYNISRDGILLVNGTYMNNVTVTWNIDNLEKGRYNFTSYFIDESDNVIIQTFILEVLDLTFPILYVEPVDDIIANTIDDGTTGNFLIWNASDIHASTFIYYINGESSLIAVSWNDLENITINIDNLDVGFYDIKIEIRDSSGNTIESTVKIRVKNPNITDTRKPIIDIEDIVHEQDKEIIQVPWFTTVPAGNEPVPNGIVRVELYKGFELRDSFEEPILSDGNFTITFDYTGLEPGNYEWILSFIEDSDEKHYQEWLDDQSIRLPFVVLPHAYSIKILIDDEIKQGEPFAIAVTVRYSNNETSSNSTLSLSEFYPISGEDAEFPNGIPVEFRIELLYLDGTRTEIIKTAITENTGIAEITLSSGETTGLLEILSIKAKVLKTDTNNLVEEEFDSSEFPEVKAVDPTTTELIFEFVRENIVIIPIIIASIVSLAIIGLKFNSRRLENIRQINNAVKSANSELQAIKSIEAIIIQTPSKLTIYEEQVASTNVNSTIIGGMVTAFSSFLDEVGKSQLFGFEMMEREGLSLTLHQGKISNIIIISTEKLPIVVLSQIKEAQEAIENSFKSNFTKTARGVSRLTIKDVHPKFHEAELKIDLVDDLIFNEKNIKRMLRQRSLSRALKGNVRLLYDFPKYFTGETYKLNDIIEFFKSKGITERVSSRTIMLAYQFDVIDSVQFDSNVEEEN